MYFIVVISINCPFCLGNNGQFVSQATLKIQERCD